MVTREEIFAEIQRVPDKHLDEIYTMIRKYEENGEESAANINVMANLRDIKISASKDLSIEANLRDLEKPDAD